MKQVEFLTQLVIIVLMDDSFRLGSDFYVALEEREIIVPEGFETDLASVPRVPVVYLAVGGRGHKAAVLHDWLYSTTMFTRKQCDQYFYHALRESGVNYFYAKAMYAGVRIGGASYYEANLERKIQEALKAIEGMNSVDALKSIKGFDHENR